MEHRILNMGMSSEHDMVAVRQRAREISGVLGFGAQDQVRIATAASELARTAFAFVSGGNVEFLLDRLGADASLLIRIKSSGDLRNAAPWRAGGAETGRPGGPDSNAQDTAALDAALGTAQRLMDDCSVDAGAGGARVIVLRKALPAASVCGTDTLAALTDHIMATPVASTFSEVHLQNRELLETLAELRVRQDDLVALTEELESTNRGVVALYAEIEEKAERLRQADVYKDEFLATLAHELRNPLAPIRNAVEIMRRVDPGNTASHAKAQQIISRQVDHLARLVDDLLDVARISKGKITLQQVPIALSVFVHSAVETVQPFIDSRQHTLSVTLPDERVLVLGDPVRLAQIVGNLLNNAAKYTVRGGVITLAAALLGKTQVRITVRDNGIGLSNERIGTVFGLFAQGETAPDRAQDGLGIGLSLVKQLVALHGGEIRVESAGPGQGSTFMLELPVLTEGSHAGAPDAAGLAVAAGMTGTASLKILLVDDNVDSVGMTAMLLESFGHVTYIAHDALSALAQAKQHVPALVLLDIGLPGADGYEVARMLRQQPELERTRLIAVTGYGTERDKEKARQAGFHHHLVKPVDLDDLLGVIAGLS